MLVQEWMTTQVLTVSPDTSVMKASRLMKENKIRRLPVVNEEGVLLGIVTDRDIKEASPSKATSLDMHELYYLLSEIKIREIMSKQPISAKPDDSVENIAKIMIEKRFGGVPVVDGEHKICGIITDSDIFKLLLAITGFESGGIQLAFEIPNAPGSLRPIIDALREYQVSIVSVLSAQEAQAAATRRVYIRLRPFQTEQEQELVRQMKKTFPLIYWEPGSASGKKMAEGKQD